MKQDSGIALISALVLVSALIALSAIATATVSVAVQSYGDSARGFTLKEATNSASLKALNAPRSGRAIDCVLSHSGSDLWEISRTLCTRRSNAPNLLPEIMDGRLMPPTLFPIIDFNTLLKSETPCVKAHELSDIFTPGGYRLSASSARSFQSCTMDSVPAIDSIATISNVTLSHPSELGVPGRNTTITASGFFEANQNLTISGDTLIIAGGDIHLTKIESDGEFSLSLFSSTGAVKIDSILGPLKLRASALLGVYLPFYIHKPGNELVPPLQEIQILGFFAES